MERIEVLRGPQGTLFGSGSMGGAIRLITKQPDLSEFESQGEVILSNTEHGGFGYEARGMINVPVAGNSAGIRAVAYYRNLDGWIDNTNLEQSNVNNNRTTGLRLAGTWFDQDRLTINGKIVYQDRQSDGSMVDEGKPPWTQQHSVEEPSRDRWTLLNLNINYELEWGRLVSTTSWFDRELDTRSDTSVYFNNIINQFLGHWPGLNVASANQDEQNEFIQEFRIHSNPNNRLDWLLGIFYQDQDFRIIHDIEAPGFDQLTGGLGTIFGAPDKLLAGQTYLPMKQIALFGDLVWPFSDRWEGHIGGRVFRFEYESEDIVRGILNLGESFSQASSDETGFTPRMGVSYSHNDKTTLYGTVAGGFRPGGTNTTSVENFPDCQQQLPWLGLTEVPRSFESDKLQSYELGIKSSWAENRVALRSALYYNDWSNTQTPAGLPCGANWIENAGSATTRGVEIELAVYLENNLELTLNGAFTDARLNEDVPGLLAKEGDELPGVPQYAFGGSITWLFRYADDITCVLRADYQYVGESYNGFDFYRLTTPSHSLTNLRASLRKNRWEGTVFINNVLGTRAVITVHDGPGGQYITTARPFTVGVSLKYAY